MLRQAFRSECVQFAEVVLKLEESDFDLPTGCPAWTVRELVAHVRTTTRRLTDMLAAPAPTRAEVDAAGYYGPAKFTAEVDTERIDSAREAAGRTPTGSALAVDFDRTWRSGHAAVVTQPAGRLVRTRHGDAMTLDAFLLTRVVEVGVHGLDLAGALGRDPWLTDPAAEVIAEMLLGADRTIPGELGWDRLTLITRATGRSGLTDPERATLDRYGLHWPTFG